ncbi:hypothetical protein [Sphingobium abikonense]|uniref:hypothetical protein n=1 Tax=Sphingobium abikonense TaxID=86193 RepID=UPI0035177654
MTYRPDIASEADIAGLRNDLNQKANASTVGGLSTSLNSKASQTALDAVAASVPAPAVSDPKSEAVNAAKGAQTGRFALEDHQHPRLTSTTIGTIGGSGTATISFTRSFTKEPGMVITEIPGTLPPQSMPATFKVESWVREVMTPTPSGAYIGCVVRCWRGQLLPTMNQVSVASLLSGVIGGLNTVIAALTGFNVFGASANGTAFSCIAVQRSD